MVLRLDGDGSLTTAIGAVRKLLFFDSDSRMPIGNSAGLRYLGDQISIEKWSEGGLEIVQGGQLHRP